MATLYPRAAGALAALVTLLPITGHAQTLGSNPRVEEALRLAVRSHPAIASERAALDAERAEEELADAWPDPVLQLGYGLREVETALGPQKQTIAMQMRVPFFGKRELRSKRARHRSRAAWHRYRSTYLGVVDAAADAYYRYAELARTTEITEQTLKLLQGIEAIARARYRTGQSRQVVVLKLQVELGTAEDRLRSLRDQRRADSARLRVALGLEPGPVLPWPAPGLDPPVSVPDDAVALRAVRERNAALLSLEEGRLAQARELELARREQLPDWTLGVQNIRTGRSDLTSFRDRGRDAWIVQLSVPVPLFRSDDLATIDRAAARLDAARQTARQASLEQERRAEQLLFEIRDAERKIELYETSLIPTADATLANALTSFRSGGSGLLDVLDAQRVLLRFQLDLVGARARRAARVVSVWTLMGRVPPGVPDVEEPKP